MIQETLDNTLITDPDAPYKQFAPASKLKRFINMVIDTIAFYLVAILIFIVIAATNSDTEISDLSAYGVMIFSIFSYYGFLESYQGKTIGKLLTRTRVVTEGGQKAGVKTILGRTAGRFIPFDGLTFLGDNGMHDRVSKTIVIDETRTFTNL